MVIVQMTPSTRFSLTVAVVSHLSKILPHEKARRQIENIRSEIWRILLECGFYGLVIHFYDGNNLTRHFLDLNSYYEQDYLLKSPYKRLIK